MGGRGEGQEFLNLLRRREGRNKKEQSAAEARNGGTSAEKAEQ